MEAVADFPRLTLAAIAVGCLPGWFWARTLYPCSGSATVRPVISCAISAAAVPALILGLTRVTGSGVTYSAVVLSLVTVFLSGLAAMVVLGPNKCSITFTDHPLSRPPTFRTHHGAGGGLSLSPAMHRALLALVIVLVLFRGYAGPVLHDWPFIRGVDQYNHAVMANEMLADGQIFPYLIYPPGFHTMTASVSLLSGLAPLDIFPLLAPLILLLPTLSLYTLARRLWGPSCGLFVAGFAGLVLNAPYQYFSDAMYPNMFTSQFLLVLAVAAVLELHARPSGRAVLLFVLLASSIVLYHQVASLYLAMLLLSIGLYALLCLYEEESPRNATLLVALVATGGLSMIYAWDTYDLPDLASSLITVATSDASTANAVTMAIGTQAPFSPVALVGGILTLPVTVLGLIGAGLLAAQPVAESPGVVDRTPGEFQRFARFVVLAWALLFALGSVSPWTGFPQRFARDLGIPLTMLAAVAFAALISIASRSTEPEQSKLRILRHASTRLALLVVIATGVQIAANLAGAAGTQTTLTFTNGLTVSPGIAAAGAWLRENNSGAGNIMVSPQGNQVPSRMMLAMGRYAGMQSYPEDNIEWNRDLPPAGADAMRDVLYVMNRPAGERTAEILEKYDVRYLVLYKRMPDRPVEPYWRGFAAHEEHYRPVFENEAVLIVKPLS